VGRWLEMFETPRLAGMALTNGLVHLALLSASPSVEQLDPLDLVKRCMSEATLAELVLRNSSPYPVLTNVSVA
jgi:hypothetical protein